MKKTEIDREELHAALDAFLDEVEKNPANVEDGECHKWSIEGGYVATTEDDVRLVSFYVKNSTTRLL